MKKLSRQGRAAIGPAETQARPAVPKDPAEAKPLCFVTRVEYAGSDNAQRWWVVARTEDADRIKSLIAAESTITVELVRGWFQTLATAWPIPEDYSKLDEFVTALKALRVTASLRVTDHHARGAERIGVSLRDIKAAIHLLAHHLPGMVSNAYGKKSTHFTPDELASLDQLALQAKQSRDIIKAPAPQPRETTWHDDACLIEWHLRRFLADAGHNFVGYGATGPLTRIMVAALKATGCHQEGNAVNAAIKLASEKPFRGGTSQRIADQSTLIG